MTVSSGRSAPGTAPDVVLEVGELGFALQTGAGPVTLVDDVSFTLRRGETLGIVGESGSGKTMLVRTIMGIAPRRGVTAGRVVLDGVDLLGLPADERRHQLGVGIGMIFQNPMTSLNPVVPVGRQITEGLRHHRGIGRRAARARAVELLEQVGIADAETRLGQYPYQLSGGMCQRVAIASALACDPAVLIADEATTALDVTIQQQILDLIKDIQAARNMAVVLISHDLGVIAGRSDQLAVMYAGQVVEAGPTAQVFTGSRHPYTYALLSATPRLDAPVHSRIVTIPGSPPPAVARPPGCAFARRCASASDTCRADDPRPAGDPAVSPHWYRSHHPRPAGLAAATGVPS